MPKGNLHIELFGTSFTITADEDPQYLEELLLRYKKMCDSVQNTTGLSDPLKISIVSGLLISDELQKTRSKHSSATNNHESSEAEKITLDLIARIDEVLEDRY